MEEVVHRWQEAVDPGVGYYFHETHYKTARFQAKLGGAGKAGLEIEIDRAFSPGLGLNSFLVGHIGN